MRIFGISASHEASAINAQILEHCLSYLRSGFKPDSEFVSVFMEAPGLTLCGADTSGRTPILTHAIDFVNRTGGCDAILLSFSEKTENWTAAFTTVFDMASGISTGLDRRRPVLVISTTSASDEATLVLNTALSRDPFLGGVTCGQIRISNGFVRTPVGGSKIDHVMGSSELTSLLKQFSTSVLRESRWEERHG